MAKKNSKLKNTVFIQLFQYPCSVEVTFVHGLPDCGGAAGPKDTDQDFEMFIDVDNETFDVLQIILHESVHIKQLVEDYIGNRLDEESEAYFIQELYNEIAACYFEYMEKFEQSC